MASVVPVLTDDLCSAQQSHKHYRGKSICRAVGRALVTAGPAGSASLPFGV
jgi:hypothetical protein